MPVLLRILTLIALALGTFSIAAIRSDIQIIIVLICFGFAIVFLALAAILSRVDDLHAAFRGDMQPGSRP